MNLGQLRWLLREKKRSIPSGADERDRAKFAKAQSYMVLLDDKAMCKNMRCRKRFDVSGVKTMARMSLVWPRSERKSRPVSISHMRTRRSAPPLALIRMRRCTAVDPRG